MITRARRRRVLRLKTSTGTLASQTYDPDSEQSRRDAITYLNSLKDKWERNPGLVPELTIEDSPL
jgi:hypothetical protein